MRIIHRFGSRFTDDQRKAFQEIGLNLPEGIALPRGTGTLTAFNIAEDDSRWNDVVRILGKSQKVDLVSTQFSKAELETAKFLEMRPESHIGQPQPVENLEYRTVTYDLTDFCTHCGLSLKQKSPFRLKSAPTLRNKSIFQLYWIPDEFFVRIDVWESVFQPFGIGGRHPILHKTGTEIKSVVQLNIQSECSLRTEQLEPLDCSVCGCRKYKFSSRGYSPEPLTDDFVIAKSVEYFGGNRDAKKLVIVSDALHRKIREAGLKGVGFYPCDGDWVKSLDSSQLEAAPLPKYTERISKNSLTAEQRNIVELVESLEDEVNNGGFDQFFYNSAGDDTAEIIQALETIGATNMADIAKRAAAKFPRKMPPKDRSKRQDVLLKRFPERDGFQELDDEFLDYPDNLADLLRKYVSH